MKLRLVNACILSLVFILASCAVPKPENFTTDQELWVQGNRLYSKGDYTESLAFFENLLQRFPQSPLRAEAELRVGDAHFEKDDFIEAESAYASFKSLHPTHEKIPYATYRIALCHDAEAPKSEARDQMHTQRAVQVLTELKNRWPESEEAKKAAPLLDKNARKLKLQDMYVANFYLKKKKYSAALGRLRDLAADSQYTDIQAEAQYKLAYALVKTGDKENAKPLLTGLQNNPIYKDKATDLLEKLPR